MLVAFIFVTMFSCHPLGQVSLGKILFNLNQGEERDIIK